MVRDGIGFMAYDTLCRIDIAAEDGSNTRALLDGARALALSVQSCLSMFDEASELSVLCRAYRVGEAMPLSPMLADFLAVTLEVSRLSGGALDPTVGPLVRLWNFLAEEPQVPPQKDLQAALDRVGCQYLELDAENRTLTIHRPGMVIDPGASGKGFALGLVVDYLARRGIGNGVVDFGGNLYVFGGKHAEDGTERPWRVALRHPDDPAGVMGHVQLQNAAVATSSWYEHSFRLGGKIYHHLLDPRTGMPVPLALKSVSVVSDAPVLTDLLSTPLFMLDAPRRETLVKAMSDRGAIGYVAIDESNRTHTFGSIDFVPSASASPRTP